MKRLTFIALIILGFCEIKGQQIHQLTTYMLNDFAYNPAIAGTSTDLQTQVGYRKQWTGMPGAPTTLLLSTHTNVLDTKKVGLGGIIYTDITGPTRRTGFQLAYAYHLLLDEEKQTSLSLGLGGTLTGTRIDYSVLNPENENDPNLLSQTQGTLTADANFGAYLYNQQYFLGLSTAQLFESKVKMANNIDDISINRHYFIAAGYRFDTRSDFSIEPSAMAKFVKGIPAHMDLNARLYYDHQYWLGVSYRTYDAIALMLGLKLNNGFNAAYAYDITTSGLNKVSSGTHEVTIGYKWNYRKN